MCNNNDSQHSEINLTTYPSIRGTSTAKLPYTNVLYTNVRSLTRGAKRDELKMLIDSHEIDIIGISETWGKADILDIEMEIPGFKLYRKDRATINNNKKPSYCWDSQPFVAIFRT